MSSGIFISYRREDSSYFTRLLRDRIIQKIHSDQVFMDVDNLEPGEDFDRILKKRVGECDVLIAVIGKRWLDIQDERGLRRLDNPNDFVRIEIEAALTREVRVIPVLIDGIRMPHMEELPEGLKRLAHRHAIEISHTRFETDADRLVRSLVQIEEARKQREKAALLEQQAASVAAAPIMAPVAPQPAAPTAAAAARTKSPMGRYAVLVAGATLAVAVVVIVVLQSGRLNEKVAQAPSAGSSETQPQPVRTFSETPTAQNSPSPPAAAKSSPTVVVTPPEPPKPAKPTVDVFAEELAITNFVAAYAGAESLPALKVQTLDPGHLVAFDLGSVSSPLPGGFAYDPAVLNFNVVHQDDGRWRADVSGLPPVSGHLTQNGQTIDMRVATTSFKQSTLIDPQIGWIASSAGGADEMSLTEKAEGIDEHIQFGRLKFSLGTENGSQALSTKAATLFDALSLVLDVQPKQSDGSTGKSVHFAVEAQSGESDVTLSDFKPAPLLDMWRFFVTHPRRADLARDFTALKTSVTALVADHFSAVETLKLDTLKLTTSIGPAAVEHNLIAIGVSNAGPNSGVSAHWSASAIKLPEGSVVPTYAALTPTSLDLGFKATGIDVEGAVEEWFADAKLDGDNPPLTQQQIQSVVAKLIMSRPIAIDIQPSRIDGASFHIEFEGKGAVEKGAISASVTLKMYGLENLGKAVASVPEADKNITPVLAMAKGLGKAQADGALLWVCELSKDHILKINGLPLGKMPF